jgi:hypothetical protein
MVVKKLIKTIINIHSKDKFFCYHCQTDFHEDDTLVIVSTHKVKDITEGKSVRVDGSLIEEVYYHGSCWKNWFMGRMETIAENKYGHKKSLGGQFNDVMNSFHKRLRQ